MSRGSLQVPATSFGVFAGVGASFRAKTPLVIPYSPPYVGRERLLQRMVVTVSVQISGGGAEFLAIEKQPVELQLQVGTERYFAGELDAKLKHVGAAVIAVASGVISTDFVNLIPVLSGQQVELYVAGQSDPLANTVIVRIGERLEKLESNTAFYTKESGSLTFIEQPAENPRDH